MSFHRRGAGRPGTHARGPTFCVRSNETTCVSFEVWLYQGGGTARAAAGRGTSPRYPRLLVARSLIIFISFALTSSLIHEITGRHRSVFFMRSAAVELVAANPAALRSRKLGGCTRKWWLGPLRRAQHHARPNRGGRPGPLLASMSCAQSSTPPSSGRTASSWTRTRGGSLCVFLPSCLSVCLSVGPLHQAQRRSVALGRPGTRVVT